MNIQRRWWRYVKLLGTGSKTPRKWWMYGVGTIMKRVTKNNSFGYFGNSTWKQHDTCMLYNSLLFFFFFLFSELQTQAYSVPKTIIIHLPLVYSSRNAKSTEFPDTESLCLSVVLSVYLFVSLSLSLYIYIYIYIYIISIVHCSLEGPLDRNQYPQMHISNCWSDNTDASMCRECP